MLKHWVSICTSNNIHTSPLRILPIAIDTFPWRVAGEERAPTIEDMLDLGAGVGVIAAIDASTSDCACLSLGNSSIGTSRSWDSFWIRNRTSKNCGQLTCENKEDGLQFHYSNTSARVLES